MAQGPAPGEPTTLYEAVQGAGQVTFVREGTAAFGYNAMGFRAADRFLYAINNNDGLARIGQGGAATNLGQVGLPSSGTFSYNQGTFGDGLAADILHVRQSTSDNSLYAVDVPAGTSTRIALSATVPNMSDIVWKDGYIWGVYGEGHRLYRIDPSDGAVLAVPLTGLPANPYGAQWVYGNGDIGISNNVTGTVCQLPLNNPTSDTPTVTILSATRGPANNQNDGAAVPGEPADPRPGLPDRRRPAHRRRRQLVRPAGGRRDPHRDLHGHRSTVPTRATTCCATPSHPAARCG